MPAEFLTDLEIAYPNKSDRDRAERVREIERDLCLLPSFSRRFLEIQRIQVYKQQHRGATDV